MIGGKKMKNEEEEQNKGEKKQRTGRKRKERPREKGRTSDGYEVEEVLWKSLFMRRSECVRETGEWIKWSVLRSDIWTRMGSDSNF